MFILAEELGEFKIVVKGVGCIFPCGRNVIYSI